MACCGQGGGGVMRTAGVGRPSTAGTGSRLVYRVMVDGECKTDPDTGECLEFSTDQTAYGWWYANGRQGHIQPSWS